MRNNQDKSIELRSGRVRNVIGQPPPSLLRYGVLIIGVALTVFLAVAAIVPYEEVLPIEVTISAKKSNELLVGQAHISGYDIGKVVVGQKVIILSSRYGNIVGFVSNISLDDSVKIIIKMSGAISIPNGGKFAGKIIISRTPVLQRILRVWK